MRSTALLLALAALAFVLPAPADADVKLTFTAPSGVTLGDLSLDVYKGYPTSSSITEATLNSLEKVERMADGSYAITEGGTYCYYVRGSGYYSICKIFVVSDAEVSGNAEKSLTLATGKIAGNGFEPCNPNLANVPSNYASNMLDNRDRILGIWPDEILAHFGTDDLVGYTPFTTPAFTKQKALHEVSSQQDMMDFINEIAARTPNMHVHSLGKTPHYSYDVPMVVFSTSSIPANASIEEIGRILRSNGKPTVWEQSQIHPNEPAAGEGALVMIQEMAGDYGKTLLDKINVVIIPRVNPDGSYLFTRVTYDNFDMNRDHTALKAKELAMIHTAYIHILPELVFDDHEFTFYGATSTDVNSPNGRMNNADDIEGTPASSLNNDPDVNKFAMDVVGTRFHKDVSEAGLRNYHYGYTVNNPIGRAYYGLFNCVSFLVETRGIGAGRTNYERRVFSHVVAAKSLFNVAAENAQELRTKVAAARQKIIDKGRTYEEDDVLVLYQTASGNTRTAYECERVRFRMDGTRDTTFNADKTGSMNDTIERSRPRPTAYILPKGEEWLDKVLYILDNQGAEYFEIAAGTTIPADQYYYVGAYTTAAGSTRGFEAGLRGEKQVTFENGAVVVPMDQLAGNVIGMTLEPDVNDSHGYDGTIVQYGLVSADASTQDFPYYRYTQDNPRALRGGGSSGSSGSGCNAAGFSGLFVFAAASALYVLRRKQ